MRSLERAIAYPVSEIVATLALAGALVFAFWPAQDRERSTIETTTPMPLPEFEQETFEPFPQAAFEMVLWTPPTEASSDSPQVVEAPPPRLNLTLLAIEEHADGRVAVFREPRTGRIFRLRPGESINEISVTDILEYEVAMTVQDRPVTKSLRRTSP